MRTLSSSSPPPPPITNKPGGSHMLSYSLMHVTSAVLSIFCALARVSRAHGGQCSCAFLSVCIHANVQRLLWRSTVRALLLHNNLLHFHQNTFAMFNTYYYTFTQQQTVIGCSQNPSFWDVLNKHRPSFWFQ